MKNQRWVILLLFLLCLCRHSLGDRKPNIIFILADDLGYAELGCYGQKKIRTPHIEGSVPNAEASGSPCCAANADPAMQIAEIARQRPIIS